jgi:GTP1/Obg family GTP-binding protein
MSAAVAQGYGAPTQQQQQPSFSDAELQTFAEAAMEVQQINQEYQPQMQQAQTPEEQQSIRDEATEKMVEAIEEKGLSVEQYNEIASAAQTLSRAWQT